MSDDIIWALDQRDRCIACPPTPLANAVVLHLTADGSLGRETVAQWAAAGVMTAGIAWPGAGAELTEDDWLDLEDAVVGLAGLASVVAVVGEGDAQRVALELGERERAVGHTAAAHRAVVLEHLRHVAPV